MADAVGVVVSGAMGLPLARSLWTFAFNYSHEIYRPFSILTRVQKTNRGKLWGPASKIKRIGAQPSHSTTCSSPPATATATAASIVVYRNKWPHFRIIRVIEKV